MCTNTRAIKSNAKSPIKFSGRIADITEAQYDQLVNLGASRWTKGDKDRLYLGSRDKQQVAKMAKAIIGLDVDFYNTGNVSSASLNGDKISNSDARGFLYAFDGLYIDLKDGGVGGLPPKGSSTRSMIINGINKYRNKK